MKNFRFGVVAALAAATAIGSAGCGKNAPAATSDGGGSGAGVSTVASKLTATTPAATKDASSATWATYREVGTLDPIQAFDFPENTIDTALCESVIRQNPDGSLVPGLAEKFTHPDDKTLVLSIRPNVHFWDGRALTASDAVFSMARAADPKGGGFYATTFERVSSIKATGPLEVTIKLKQPDFWLDGELSGMAGIVIEKAFAEKAGAKYGTSSGGAMCTGAFKLKSWKPGSQLVAVRNDDYWDAAHKAKLGQLVFKGIPDESSLTSGFLTGAVDGAYNATLSTYNQLKSSGDVTISSGPAWASDAVIVSSLSGALGDVRVRQALSLAIDRPGYISAVYHDQAQMPRTLANPGSWSYGTSVFESNAAKHPEIKQNLAKAKALIKQAGAAGKTIVIGMSSEIPVINAGANAVRQAGTSIGLKVKLKAVSAQNYINFFTDAKSRKGLDAFPTINYSDFADPAAFYATFALKGGTQNYSGWSDPAVTKALGDARSTADPDARARLVTEAGDVLVSQLPWIPMAEPNSVLITSKKLTGAPSSFVYMGGPWANALGGS